MAPCQRVWRSLRAIDQLICDYSWRTGYPVTIWPILLLNSIQIVTSIDRRLLNGLLMQDYAPFVLTAVQWP